MRTVRLARVLAEAEALRLRRMVRRLIISAVMAIVAVLFLLAALAVGHFAIYLALEPSQGDVHSVLYLLAGDVVIAVVVGGFIAINGPGKVEREALEVRQTARLQLKQSLTVGAMIAEATRAIGPRQAVSLVKSLVGLAAKRRN